MPRNSWDTAVIAAFGGLKTPGLLPPSVYDGLIFGNPATLSLNCTTLSRARGFASSDFSEFAFIGNCFLKNGGAFFGCGRGLFKKLKLPRLFCGKLGSLKIGDFL